MSYRFLHTLVKPWRGAHEPNLTILWSQHLAHTFLRNTVRRFPLTPPPFQYENDDLMREKIQGMNSRHRVLRFPL
jgi:pyruvate-formate lyase